MSAVLWANRLYDGTATCDQSDKWAPQRHTQQLDRPAKRAAAMGAVFNLCVVL